jgi:hypothetical protein
METVAASEEALEWVLGKIAASKKAVGTIAKLPKIEPAVIKKPKDVTALRTKELDLWKQYKESGDPKHYQALLSSHMPVIYKTLNTFKSVEVNKSAQVMNLMQLHKDAMDAFDPKNVKGANLTTWLTTRLKGHHRYIGNRQNLARMSEPKNLLVGQFKTGVQELISNLNREPSLQEIHEHTGLPEKTVRELSKQIRKSYDIDAGGDELAGFAPNVLSVQRMAAKIIYPSCTPDEKLLHDYIYPKDGRRAVPGSGDLAKKLGWDLPKVSKVKGSLKKKMDEFIPD